jgi:DNA-binding CsgD family transcriptional regulator
MTQKLADLAGLLRSGAAMKSMRFSLRLRLAAFLVLFVVTLMLLFSVILFGSGVFSAGLNESRLFFQNEHTHIAGGAEESLGILAVEGVTLSRRLSQQIGHSLNESGSNAGDMQGNLELTEEILRDSTPLLLSALEKNMTSAVFLVLDATARPDGAENSRAGLFIRNMEPNVIDRSEPSIRYMRGPISIARERSIAALPQWAMEFAVTPGDFFHTTMDGAKDGSDLSRLYYWNPAEMLAGDYEDAIMLCVPILAEDGAVLGVCGFEISTMLFKKLNIPDVSVFSHAFSLLAPIDGDTLDMDAAMFASTQSTRAVLDGSLRTEEYKGGLSAYTAADGTRYVGLHREIKMYPKNAVHGGETWALAVLVPQSELDGYASEKNNAIIVLLIILSVGSILAAVFLSKRYLSPVLRALEQLKKRGSGDFIKTNIREIDDLYAFLAEQDEEREREAARIAEEARVSGEPFVPAAEEEEPDPADQAEFAAFLKRLDKLSQAERAVFNLYNKGYDAKEVSVLLYISLNTVKTHNRRIYYKLEVNSLKTLRAYLRTMKEKGCVIHEGEQNE